jgi:uncharacterized membrane protein YphA (DoxX/SURF4 family)
MTILIILSRIFISYIFIISGWVKISQTDDFIKAINSYQILPKLIIKPFAIVLARAELILGVFTGLGLFTKISSLLIIGFLSMFLIAFTITIFRGKSIDCGCFGKSNSQKVGWNLVLRDVLLIVFSIGVYFFNGGGYGLDNLLK